MDWLYCDAPKTSSVAYIVDGSLKVGEVFRDCINDVRYPAVPPHWVMQNTNKYNKKKRRCRIRVKSVRGKYFQTYVTGYHFAALFQSTNSPVDGERFKSLEATKARLSELGLRVVSTP